ncbi:Vacuolar_protein sorting 4b [Hexamita inflata]|uniref:Vacuolar_protein sorting 4b n=1 Tax=Hexamita inflata TaxID=28002 RepID=A0ABP1GZN8_9EUKA
MDATVSKLLDMINVAVSSLQSNNIVDGCKQLNAAIIFANKMLKINEDKQHTDQYKKVIDIRDLAIQKYNKYNPSAPINQQLNQTNNHYLTTNTNLTNLTNNNYQQQGPPSSPLNSITSPPQLSPLLSQLTLQEQTKTAFMNSLISPQLRPDLFTGNRKPPQSILLFGPSGTGKTMVTKAAANEAKLSLVNIAPSAVMSKFVGESEQQLKAIFQYCQQFKCIAFFDEIDSMLCKRGEDSESARRVKTEFLQLTDGAQAKHGFLLVGATNRPQDLDDAVKRRFQERIYLGLPTNKERYSVIKENAKHDENSLSNNDFTKLSQLTERYSYLKQLAQKAALNTLKGKDLMINIRINYKSLLKCLGYHYSNNRNDNQKIYDYSLTAQFINLFNWVCFIDLLCCVYQFIEIYIIIIVFCFKIQFSFQFSQIIVQILHEQEAVGELLRVQELLVVVGQESNCIDPTSWNLVQLNRIISNRACLRLREVEHLVHDAVLPAVDLVVHYREAALEQERREFFVELLWLTDGRLKKVVVVHLELRLLLGILLRFCDEHRELVQDHLVLNSQKFSKQIIL